MLKNISRHFILLICCVLFSSITNAQNKGIIDYPKQILTLNDVLNLANKKSLDAFKAKREYGVSYWGFKSFKSSLLPKVDFTLQPLTYNRSVIQRYDSELNIDVYRSQQNLNSYANLSVTQNIRATGTNLYINSTFNRLENYGALANESYNATPISVGLIQPLMAFNEFKWQHKIAPLEYEKAKQDFIYEMQAINLKTVNLFFSWALASKKLEIAQENKVSSEKLFKIGKQRYDIGSIEKDDLLNLELDVYNANTKLTQNEQVLEKAEAELILFLRVDLPSKMVPELPELISNLQINVDDAIRYANTNNPDILNLKLRKVKALRDLDQAIKNNRFDLFVTASYGLNQQGNTFNAVYGNFLEQEMVAIQLNIPILDWGERKGNIKTAKMNKEVIDIELQQDEDTYKQNITIKVNDFNLQRELVLGTLRTSEISKESYKITEKRFLSGQVDLLNLSSSRQAWQLATENYIQSLQSYWTLYYGVQQLTLFNFMSGNNLKQDFNTILDD
ncbi:TolC family protein [Flavivirga aquimarina]|uniref:TolC family protein n=1 Tax=Flavivirga aquimarina TaxID=2027862 RepID=A0ABT8WCK2_9FLAO|nr:TolC family protein [Flavivirga aquimarina]MDO5970751.1 TolC family protein [Flavivirga aquimarina]